MPKIFLAAGIILLWFLTPIFTYVHAADNTSLGLANDLPIVGSTPKNGDIISLTQKGYTVSTTAYDPSVIGVVSTSPALELNDENVPKNTYPVMNSGRVDVNVTNENGNIKAGDLIAASSKAGVGMRSTKSGFVLGVALADFSNTKKDSVGIIPVSLNLHYSYIGARVDSNLKDILNLSILASYESPSAVFKYVVAGLVVIMSCFIGFISFGRAANTGLEALGRNPLAGKMIQLGIIFNVVITLGILLAGLGIAIFIVRL